MFGFFMCFAVYLVCLLCLGFNSVVLAILLLDVCYVYYDFKLCFDFMIVCIIDCVLCCLFCLLFADFDGLGYCVLRSGVGTCFVVVCIVV